ASFSPEGWRLLTAGYRAAQLWELLPPDRDEAAPTNLPTDGWAGQKLSYPSGTYLIGATRRLGEGGIEVHLADARGGTRSGPPLPLPDLLMFATSSPDGRYVATVNRVGKTRVEEVRVWDAARGAVLWRYAVLGKVHDAAFSAGGDLFALATGEGVG